MKILRSTYPRFISANSRLQLMLISESNHKSIGQNGAFLNHYDSVFYYIERMIGIFQMMTAVDTYIISYAAILVDYCVLNITPRTDAHIWYTMTMCMINFLESLKVIIPHDITAHDGGAVTNSRPDSNDAIFYP